MNSMKVRTIVADGIRNLSSITVALSDGFNVVYGDNAQGKSSLLESVHILCTSFSYRTKRITEIVNWDKESGYVRGSIEVVSHPHVVYVSLSSVDGKKQVVLDDKKVRATDLFKKFPVVSVSRSIRSFVDGSQEAKRRFIDYLLFRIDPEYSLFYYRYIEVLKNRNHLLKHYSESMKGLISSLGEQMIEYGHYILDRRVKLIERINTFIGRTMPAYIKYEPALMSDTRGIMDREIRIGYSLMGPHRDKMHILIKDKLFDKFGSSGEKELYGVLIKMAEVEILREHYKYWPLVILDDVDIMMVDRSNVAMMLDYLLSTPVQVLIATVYPNMWPKDANLIHMSRGCILAE